MSKILLIFGSGPRVGQATIAKFASAGYKVVSARSTKPDESKDIVHMTVDLSDPTSIQPVFDKVEKLWGAPSVVVYNAAFTAKTPNGFLAAPLSDLTKSLNINTISAWTVASVALAKNPKVVFLYTGNVTNARHLPGFTLQGIGKNASAYWIQAAADQGLPARFYYCDQRTKEGEPVYDKVDGEGHATLFLRLAEQEKQGEAVMTFVP